MLFQFLFHLSAKRKGGEMKKGQQNFWSLWEHHKDFLHSICNHYTGNYHNAEDLLSDVMLKACTSIREQELPSNSKAWLRSLLKNTFIDKYRKGHKRKIHISYVNDIKIFDNEEVKTYSNPLGKIIEDEVYKLIESSIQKMPPLRKLLTRMYYSGYSYKEIAQSYEIKADNLRKMIQLSRHELLNDLKLYQNGDPVNAEIQNDRKLFLHLIKIKHNQSQHYLNYVSYLPPNRLEQKENTIKKYLKTHPKSYDRQVRLVVNLCSQGKVYQALELLQALIMNNQHCEDVYKLTIKLLYLLDRKGEIAKYVCKAEGLSPLLSSSLYIWDLLAKGKLLQAEATLKANFKENSTNVNRRLQLIQLYDLQGKDLEAYTECEKIHIVYPGHPEIYLIHLENKFYFDGFYEACKFAEKEYKRHPESAIHCFFYLHFLLSEGSDLSKPDQITLFNHVRKKYFWHPDFSLLKAMLSPDKKVRILKRRCNDHPDCALSHYYFSEFTGCETELVELNSQEKTHISIIRMIYEEQRVNAD